MDEDITDLNLRGMVNAVDVASDEIYNAKQAEETVQTPISELKWSQDEENFDSEMQQLIPTATQIDNSFEEASFEGNDQSVETTESTVSQFVKTDPSTTEQDNVETQLETEDQTVVKLSCTNEEINVGSETKEDVKIDSDVNEFTKENDATDNYKSIEEKVENKDELEILVVKEDMSDDVVIIENDKDQKVEEKLPPKRRSKLRPTEPAKKKAIDCNKKCRICMEDNPTISLFTSRDPVPGNEKMLACSAIQITEDDGLPQFICRKCDTNLDISYQLKILCEKSDMMFREMLGVKNKTIVKRELVLLDCNDISDSSEDMSIANYKAKKSKSNIDSDCEYSPSKSKKGRKKNVDKTPATLSNKAIKLNHVAQAAIMTPKYVCKHCNKVFVRVETYNNHLETHKANKYQCPSCSESFKTEKAQHIHTKMAHAVMPKINYKCSKCDKEYELMRHLKIHEASHNREKKYKCDVCAAVFSNLVGLTQHKKEKHPVEGKTFQCKTCNLRFRNEDAVKRHAQIAHFTKSSEEKKPLSTRDLFKSIAPLTSTYWSDSYSD